MLQYAKDDIILIGTILTVYCIMGGSTNGAEDDMVSSAVLLSTCD